MNQVVKVSTRTLNLGTENAFVVLKEVNELLVKGKDIINFCIGQPDFDTPNYIKQAAIKAIKDGKTGLLVQLKNYESISDGILKLLNDNQKAHQLGQSAKKHISHDFNVEKMVENLDKVYSDEIVKKRKKFSF